MSAGTGPQWSAQRLADFSDVIVTGRVVQTVSAWDPANASIYTYVTVDVAEVIKGAVGARIVIKQLGGEVDGVGLAVAEQAAFDLGENVLLYLESRPRDGTLYTAALWQGKWRLESGTYGDAIAVRTSPEGAPAGRMDAAALSSLRRHATAPARVQNEVDDMPDEAPSIGTQAFALLGPFRWLVIPPVDIQAGGQPGLAGGGTSQVASAIARWNAAGTGTRLVSGTSAGPKCTHQLTGTGRVTITFDDPCGEMSDSGGTIAIGGAAYFQGQGGTNNGVTFGRAVEGFVILNNSSIARGLLQQAGCFEDVQTHELGHVLGLDHSVDSNAIMFASINNSCSNGAHALGTDDRAGIAAIYGGGTTPGTTPPSTAPVNVTVIVNGTVSLTVSWNAVTALVASAPAAATSYRIDFRATPTGAVLVSATSTSTTLPVAIPAGVLGTFYVTVTGLNSGGAGPSSAPVAFTIGSSTPGPGPCTSAPGPVSGVSGSVAGGIARVQWAASAGASTYLVQAGSTQGVANLFPLTDIGNNLGAQAPVPPGFTAWVRIFARNACGTSTGVDFFLQ